MWKQKTINDLGKSNVQMIRIYWTRFFLYQKPRKSSSLSAGRSLKNLTGLIQSETFIFFNNLGNISRLYSLTNYKTDWSPFIILQYFLSIPNCCVFQVSDLFHLLWRDCFPFFYTIRFLYQLCIVSTLLLPVRHDRAILFSVSYML